VFVLTNTRVYLSVVENIKEALVKLFLPKDALGCHAENDETLVRARVYVQELALLRLEVSLARACRVVLRRVQLVGYRHIHLDLDAREVNFVVLIAHNQVLVAIVPEKWVRLHLNYLVGRGGCVALSVILETLHMVQLDRNDRTSLRVLYLKSAIEDADLQPVVTIELRDKVTCGVAKSEFLGVAREHNLGDIDAEKLAFLRLAKRVKQNVIYGTFLAANDGLATVLIEVDRLVFHVDLLFKLQVLLAEDEDLAFESDVDVGRGTHRAEHLHCLTLTVHRRDQAQII